MLWGYLKDKVYVSKPKTVQELKASIKSDMRHVTVGMMDRTISDLR